MKNVKNFLGIVCIVFALVNIFSGKNFGFTLQTGTGTLDPSNIAQLIGYNFAAVVWYAGAVWFVIRQFKRKKSQKDSLIKDNKKDDEK